MLSITIDIPDELAGQFGSSGELRRAVFEDFVIEQRHGGNLDLQQAARLLGLTPTEFFELVEHKGLVSLLPTDDEAEKVPTQFPQTMERLAT